jgi:flagellar hook-length control protein FliK
MSWNDLSLSALGSASANAGVSSQAAAGLRDAGTGSSFEQELKRQTEAGDSSETAKGNTTATARPVTAAPATATAGPDKATAEPAAGTAADDTPADWLALLGGMRAMAEAKPAEAVPEPLAAAASAAAAVAKAVAQPVIDPVTAWAAPGAGEPVEVEVAVAVAVAVAADAATPATKPASAPAKDTEHQTSEPLPLANALLDGTQLPPLFAPLSTAAPALQPAAPVIDGAAAPASAALKSATDSPGQRAQQPPDLPEPGQLDAVAARALAAAAPQPTRPAAVPTGAAANAPDTLPAFEALALPAATGLAAATERLPELVPVARHVATPLGQRGWDQAVSQQVSWLVRDQLQSASLSLNPPHLGPIQVTLQLDQQQATVQFVAAAPEARQALQDALPTLRAMLGEAGISLGQADVGSRQPERERVAPQRSARGAPAAEDEPLEALAQPRAQGGGLVNLFA